MKSKTFSAIGGWQSFLFCIGMYAVALIFSIFVCSSIFYAVNSKQAVSKTGTEKASVINSAKQELASVAH
jgi:type III secretory pathway component EscR